MPIVRTFVPVVAGMAQMDTAAYTIYNVIGGVAWIWSMLFIGYFLGRYIPGVDRHIERVIAIVILALDLAGHHRLVPEQGEPNGVHAARIAVCE